MLNSIFLEWRVIFSSVGSVLPGSHKGCPLNKYVFYQILIFPVFMKARELVSDLYNTIFLEISQTSMYPSERSSGPGARATMTSRLSRCRSLTASLCVCPSPVPERLSQAKEAERLHPARPQRYCAGTVSALAGHATLATWLRVFSRRGSAEPWAMALCPPAAPLWQVSAQPSLCSHSEVTVCWYWPPLYSHHAILQQWPIQLYFLKQLLFGWLVLQSLDTFFSLM